MSLIPWRLRRRLPILARMAVLAANETRLPSSGLSKRHVLGWVLCLLVVAALVARRAALLGTLPPGLDGGQWLAIGRGLLGGEGRSTPSAYAPLVPLLTASLAEVVGSPEAVRLVALGSYLLVVVAIASVAGSMFGGLAGAAIAAAMGSAGALNEPLAFGGYPQQVALAALVVAGWAAARLCWREGRGNLALLAAGLVVAALAHHVYFPLALTVLAATCGLAAFARAPAARSAVVRVAALAAAAILLALPTLTAFLRFGYAPPLDAVDLSLAGAWRYGTREAPWLWLTIVLVGGAALLATPSARRGSSWTFALAMAGIGDAAFVVSGEPRVLPLVLLGGLFGVAVGLRFLTVTALSLSPLAPNSRRGAVSGAVLALIAALLVLPGDRVTREYLDFYRVLDPSLLAAAGRIEAFGRPVAVRADRRGWPIGWWLEGLTAVPVAVGSDPRWLGIPAERQRAAEVALLFDGGLSPTEVRERANRLGVELLLLRKWEWIGWERWLAASPAPAVEPIFDDGVTLLLRVLPPDDSSETAGV